MWDWIKDTATIAWDYAKDNVFDVVKDFTAEHISSRISGDERAALLAAQSRGGIDDPSLTGYRVNASRSIAGVSGYGDIQEATGTKYAQLLYYTKQYLKSKQQFEGSVPSITYKKSGLGSR